MKKVIFTIVMLQMIGFNGKAQPGSFNNLTSFIGAELTVNVQEPGKLKVELRTFYNSNQAVVPQLETIRIYNKDFKTPGKEVKLQKVSESMHNSYAPVIVNNSAIPNGTKTVLYTGVIEAVETRGISNIGWVYTGVIGVFNNVDLGYDDSLALIVSVDNSATAYSNRMPVMGRSPLNLLSSQTQADCSIDVSDDDRLDFIEITLGSPQKLKSGKVKSVMGKATDTTCTLLENMAYRRGYSADKPCGEWLSFNKKNSKLHFNKLPFGIYLIAVDITDFNDKKAKSNHQAIFIISSIL